MIQQTENNTKAGSKRLRIIVLIFSVIIAAWICSSFFVQVMMIQGTSMEPAYHNLQMVLLDKMSRQYKHGDVVAFRCEQLSAVLVKRIVAGPGETAVIQQGTLFINEQNSNVFPEEGVFAYAGTLDQPIILGQGQYLVIGDNLAESKDSRYPMIGIISEADIIGKVL